MNEAQKQALENYVAIDIRYEATKRALEMAREADSKAHNEHWSAFIKLREAFNIKGYSADEILVELAPRIRD